MSVHIIIDGYNLIRRSPELSILDQRDIQMGRDVLIDMLTAYKKIKPHRITVVFDGQNAPLSSHKRDNQKGILIIFSNKGETADSLIKKIARKEKEKALVVSSDMDVVNSALGSGSSVISSSEFEEKLALARFADPKGYDENEDKGWIPTTKKKGPRKRLPRQLRQNKRKTDKL